jgi:hypothetical protein
MVDTPVRKRVVRFTKREARRMFDAGAERVEFDPKTGRLIGYRHQSETSREANTWDKVLNAAHKDRAS